MGRKLAGGCCLLLLIAARLGKVPSGEIWQGLLLVAADCCLRFGKVVSGEKVGRGLGRKLAGAVACCC